MIPHPACAAALAIALLAPTAAMAPSSGAEARVLCHGRVATIVGTPGDDHLHGTPANDVIAGLHGHDVIRGRAGDDVICGGTSSDHLYGGAGGDRIFDAAGLRSQVRGGPGDDRVDEAAKRADLVGGTGSDVLTSRSTVLLILRSEPGDDRIVSRRPVQLHLDLSRSPVEIRLDLTRGVLRGRGRTSIRLATGTRASVQGSRYDDVMVGGPLSDSFDGLGGDDVLEGRTGGDALTGGSGRNLLRGGRGGDYLADGELGQGRDAAHGGPGNDHLRFSSNDVVDGGPGDDLVHVPFKVGATGTVDGGSGSNWLVARLVPRVSGKPWSHALIDLRSRRVVTDGHVMTFRGGFHRLGVRPGGALRWTLRGTASADAIASTRPRQRYPIVVRARGGADSVGTGGGDDVIWGGAGNDSVQAGNGTDTCHSIESDPDATCETSEP
jgi:Ca2+-binding RTX toxin-like protein